MLVRHGLHGPDRISPVTCEEVAVVLKDKRNKRHVGSIRPAFDRFPGRITASYTRFMSTSQRELPRSADFFRGGRRIADYVDATRSAHLWTIQRDSSTFIQSSDV